MLHLLRIDCVMFPFDLDKILDQFVYDKTSPLIFSSGAFLFFFLGFLVIYRLLRNQQQKRILWSILFSLFFYYKSSGVYFVLLIISVLIDYHAARLIEASELPSRKKLFLVLSLISNLGLLAYFKYTNYFVDLWNQASGGHLGPFDIFLPVGISFFTFQSMSYTIDVYRGNLKALDNYWDFSFYVTFFPQMVAGPIVRAADFLPQINKPLELTREDLGRAVFLFATGLFKKAVISDYISQNFVDRVFDSPLQYSGMENLMAVYGYAMQIYCDFSGYSDMAIGIGLLLGFRFPINFDSPYQSLSITEFWRRWHISLSTWLRDYLYIPLGGNRKGRIRTYVNLLLTMLLGGLWHGAATRFIIWGALHGGMLAVERWIKETIPGSPGPMRRFLGGLFTFHFVCLCWIFFRAQSVEAVGQMLSQIAFFFHPQVFFEFIDGYPMVVFWLSVGYFLHLMPAKMELRAQSVVTAMPLPVKALFVTLVIALVMQVKSADVQPFIYFQF
ncbi:MAG: MBOAT family O-acyltransferase [Saprospiraceae bacterium]